MDVVESLLFGVGRRCPRGKRSLVGVARKISLLRTHVEVSRTFSAYTVEDKLLKKAM